MNTNLEKLRIDHKKVAGKKPRIFYFWLWVALFIAGGGGGVYYFFRKSLEKSRVHATAVKPIETLKRRATTTLTAGGYLEVKPPGAVIVSALVLGQVDQLLVVEGSSVKKGKLIAHLDTGLYQRELGGLQAALSVAQSRLSRLQAGFRKEEIAQARAKVDFARAKLLQAQEIHQRNRELFKIGTLPRKKLEASKAEYKSAQANLVAFESILKLKQNGTRPEDIAVAKAEVNVARTRVALAQWRLDQCKITSPVDGVVLKQFAQVGELVTPKSEKRGKIVSVFDPKQIQAWVDINQRDIRKVRVGQSVQLKVSANPNRDYKGRVSRISPRASLQKNTVQETWIASRQMRF